VRFAEDGFGQSFRFFAMDSPARVIHRFKRSGGQGTYNGYSASTTAVPISAALREVNTIEPVRPRRHVVGYGGKRRQGRSRGGVNRL
jgi:hypothetical protein